MNKEIIRQQWQAIGQPRYQIGMINQHTGKHMMDARDWLDMERKLSRYATMNANDENIYIKAFAEIAHNVVMQDDISIEGIEFLKSKEYLPACVVETSAGNYQAWFRLPFVAPASTRKAIEHVLIAALAQQGLSADKKSADGCHYGRLAGFRNCKPKHDGFIVLLTEATGHQLTKAQGEFLLEAAKQLDFAKETPVSDAELDDIRGHRYTNPGKMSADLKWLLPSLQPTKSQSEQDWYIACRLAKRGHSQMDIAKTLLEHGPGDTNRKNDPAYYLLHTAQKAIGAFGPVTSAYEPQAPKP